MIGAKKIDRLKNIFGNITSELFLLIGIIIRTILMVFIVFGAVSSMLLLYKLFPEIAIILFAPSFIICEVLYKIFLILAIGLVFFICIYLSIYILEWFEKEKKKQELKKKQFMEEIVKKLKGNIKKE